jgi:hypothetical protein
MQRGCTCQAYELFTNWLYPRAHDIAFEVSGQFADSLSESAFDLPERPSGNPPEREALAKAAPVSCCIEGVHRS